MKQDKLPLFKEIDAKHVTPAIQHDLEKLKADFAGTVTIELKTY